MRTWLISETSENLLSYLTRREMSEYIKQVDALFHCPDCLKRGTDGVLHHDLQVFDPVSELVVVVVPRGRLHVQNGVFDVLEDDEVASEGVLNLLQTANNVWTSLTREYGHHRLLSVLVSRKVHLTFTYLQKPHQFLE